MFSTCLFVTDKLMVPSSLISLPHLMLLDCVMKGSSARSQRSTEANDRQRSINHPARAKGPPALAVTRAVGWSSARDPEWHPSPWVIQEAPWSTPQTERGLLGGGEVWGLLWDSGKEHLGIVQDIIRCLGEEDRWGEAGIEMVWRGTEMELLGSFCRCFLHVRA